MRVIRLARGRWELLLLADERGRCLSAKKVSLLKVEDISEGEI